MLVHEHDDRLLPRVVGRSCLRAVARSDIAVRLALEPVDERVRDISPGVEADIDDHGLLSHDILVGLALELGLVVVAHGGDVQVADFVSARLLDVLAQTIDAILVIQIVPLLLGQNLVLHRSRPGLAGVGVDQELELPVLLVIDEFVELLVEGQVVAVDGQNIFARLDPGFEVGAGRAGRHLAHAKARSAAITVIEHKPQLRRDRLRGAAGGRGDFRVRGFQFPDHPLQKPGELVAGLHRFEQRLILAANRHPIPAVKVWIVKPAMVGLPKLSERSPALRPHVPLPVGRERHLLRALALHPQGVELAVLGVERLLPVLGDAQLRLATPGGQSLRLLAVIRHGPNIPFGDKQDEALRRDRHVRLRRL